MEDLSHYNPEGSIKRLAQERMLEIMSTIHDLCKDHKLTYWLDYGTLLGAIRHGGFIPWDDDLDISIPEEEYPRFVEVMNRYLPQNYVLQSWETEPKLGLKGMKIRDRHSFYADPEYPKGTFDCEGIFVDVFLSCPVISKESRNALDAKYGKYFRQSRLNKSILKRWAAKLGLMLTQHQVNTHQKTAKKQKAYFANTFGGLNFKNCHPTAELFPISEVQFEGRTFYAPNNPDAHLKQIYGDYMRIPPVEKRQIHTTHIEIFQ